MRKIITLLAFMQCLLATAQVVSGEYMYIFRSDKSVERVEIANIDSVTFVDPFEAVDLGLSVKWATCNVGATKPEEYGGYYAWGETEEKDDYSWETYKWCNGSSDTMTKYCTDSDYGTVDNKTVLEPEDDVAHVKWGGDWRMPTTEEQRELVDECTWEWTTLNGVNGYKVTGSNGNSIFLPAAGYRYGTVVNNRGSYGYYWSSSLYSNYSYYAFYLLFYDDGYDWSYYSRYYGLSVRPVCDKTASPVVNYTVSVSSNGNGSVSIGNGTETSSVVVEGSSVTIVATANSGYGFAGWFVGEAEEPISTDSEYTFTVSEDIALVAKFNQLPLVALSCSGNGTVSFADSAEASQYIQPGSEVTVIATPGGIYEFVGWFVGDAEEPISTDAEYTFIVSESVTLVAKFTMPVGEAIDLGLPSGIKWASFNVGASNPEEYGGYYAWGETEEKDDYSWETYKWCNGSSDTMTKYCTNSSYGIVDNKTVLEPDDDVAHVKWGGDWRMPTKAEQDELRTKCTWTWTTLNGVNGYKVTGSNGNSIFLPAAGYRYGTDVFSRGYSGNYWSSSLSSSLSYYAYGLGFDDNSYGWSYYDRYYGQSVRPVCE